MRLICALVVVAGCGTDDSCPARWTTGGTGDGTFAVISDGLLQLRADGTSAECASISPCATVRLDATSTVEGDFLWRVSLNEFASGGESSRAGAFVFDQRADRSFWLSVLTVSDLAGENRPCRSAGTIGGNEGCRGAPDHGVIEFRRTGSSLYGRFTDDGELDQSWEIQNEEEWVLESSFVGIGLFLRVPQDEELATSPSTTATFEDSSLTQATGDAVVDAFDCNSIAP